MPGERWSRASQVPKDKLGTNDSPADLPYPVYQSISGDTFNAISNYNSLQASITRRLTSGLSFNFNYVWSHFIDDQDSSAYGGAAGTQTVQRSYDPAASYGASNYDVRNAFKGRIIYQLPFGKDKMFLNHNRLLHTVVDGWGVAGTLVASSGFPFTPTISGSNNSFSQAGDWYPNQIGSPRPAHRSISEWYNPSAYALPARGTFGDLRRNNIYGPGLQIVNLSAGKTFSIADGVQVQIRPMPQTRSTTQTSGCRTPVCRRVNRRPIHSRARTQGLLRWLVADGGCRSIRTIAWLGSHPNTLPRR